MNKTHFAFSGLILMAVLTACNGNESNSQTNSEDKATTGTTSIGTNHNNTTSSGSTATNAKLPLNQADSTFVMKAAVGGMMEVEAGRIAQQNAQSERVKAYAAMMVKDHSTGNQDLMASAGSRGMQVPPSLPPDVQKHINAMRNMKGKAFDAHYMSMMVNDHKKTVDDFQKQASGSGNNEIKSFAEKMLPVLIMHRDSATAIHQSIK